MFSYTYAMSDWALLLIFLLILVSIPLIFALSIGIAARRSAREAEAELAKTEALQAAAVPAAATLVSARVLAVHEAQGTQLMRVTLQVQPPAGEEYLAVSNWEVQIASASLLQPGQPLSVKVDPNEPKLVFPNFSWARLSLWG